MRSAHPWVLIRGEKMATEQKEFDFIVMYKDKKEIDLPHPKDMDYDSLVKMVKDVRAHPEKYQSVKTLSWVGPTEEEEFSLWNAGNIFTAEDNAYLAELENRDSKRVKAKPLNENAAETVKKSLETKFQYDQTLTKLGSESGRWAE